MVPTVHWFLNASDLPSGKFVTMHNAPPVFYPVGRFVWGRWLLIGLCVLSAAGIVHWQMQSLTTEPKVWSAWLFWCICTLSAALWGSRQILTEGQLGWSGESWYWRADGDAAGRTQSVAVSVGLDTGRGLLLWLQPLDEQDRSVGRLLSAWIEEGGMSSKWHGIRCAVYSRPNTASLLKSV